MDKVTVSCCLQSDVCIVSRTSLQLPALPRAREQTITPSREPSRYEVGHGILTPLSARAERGSETEELDDGWKSISPGYTGSGVAPLGRYMRSFEPAAPPALFGAGWRPDDASVILDCLLPFVRGYASRIEARTAHLRAGESDIGKWALDLTSAAVFSLVLRGYLRYPSIQLLGTIRCHSGRSRHSSTLSSTAMKQWRTVPKGGVRLD